MKTTFPLHLFPEPVKSYVTEGARMLGCDPTFIAVPLLPALASAIGNSRLLLVKRGWNEPAVVWACIVAESGTMKSPAYNLAIKYIHDRTKKIMYEYAEAKRTHAIEHKKWKAAPKDTRGDEPTPPPPHEHPLCNDATIEGLVDRLQDTPRGTILAKDELAGWFTSFTRYKASSDESQWLEMSNAGSVKNDRKGGDRKTSYVPRAAVSVVGTIQPEVLRREMSAAKFESGMAARILTVMPLVSVKKWNDDEISDETDASMASLFDRLYGLGMGVGKHGPEPVGGAIDHASYSAGNLKDTCLIWRDLWMEADGAVYGKFEIIQNHPLGQAFKAQIEAGLSVGFSTSGSGSAHSPSDEERKKYGLDEGVYAAIMNSDFALEKIDSVDSPSVADARLAA